MIRLVIPGPPPQKNAKHRVFASRHKPGVVGRALTATYKAWRDKVLAEWTLATAEPAQGGAWQIAIRSYWPRMRHLDVDLGIGDVDAPVECVLDALQYAEVIDDDARIVRLTASKHYDKQNPRIEIELCECEHEGQQALREDTFARF